MGKNDNCGPTIIISDIHLDNLKKMAILTVQLYVVKKYQPRTL